MEAEAVNVHHQPRTLIRLLSAAVPVILIAISYVDPGKWAAAVDGGAHFGSDLVVPLFVFNLTAILCQYLSARIAIVTGKDLAQICSEEYGKVTCLCLGIQVELSMIALDLTMILGTAHGLNLVFGVDLLSGVFLAAIEAALFPLFANLLETGKAKVMCISAASFILFSYVFGVLLSQPEFPLTIGGMAMKLSEESAFALMGLLGANIMPHNLYLHSSIIQQDHGSRNVSKRALCHDHLFAIICIFSGIFIVNYVLLNSAGNLFYGSGLVLLTFQDALSLMDQAFRGLITPFFLLSIMLVSNQITALTWNFGKQTVLHDFLGLDIPGWLHHATIRVIAVVPALFCAWSNGAEGIYQILLFIQVITAIMLPSSLLPLFRIASSRPIMGPNNASKPIEFLAFITFVGILGLKMVFLVELIFGNSDWVGNLSWNAGTSVSGPYFLLLFVAVTFVFFTLWLAATPLKSTISKMEPQGYNWDLQLQKSVPKILSKETNENENENDFGELYQVDEPVRNQEMLDFNLPETLLDSDSGPHLTTIEEDCSSDITFSEMSVAKTDTVSETTQESTPTPMLAPMLMPMPEVTEKNNKMEVEGGDSWDLEEVPSKGTVEVGPSMASSDGPGSFRSLSGKSDETGSGFGSLSRLVGLGRAARRQLTVVLDEFWGQFFDFHGQATQEAKAKKLIVLLGADSVLDSKPERASDLKVDIPGPKFKGYYPCGWREDSGLSSGLYGVQRGSSPLLSSHLKPQSPYLLNSGLGSLDPNERRYSSLRLPLPSSGRESQPATIHGYQIASYLDRISRERNSEYLNGQKESLNPNSPSFVLSSYREQSNFSLSAKPQYMSSTQKPPGFENVSVYRNNSLHPESPFYDLSSPGSVDNSGRTVTAKKYYSLPDISGRSAPQRDSSLSHTSALWDSNPYGQSGGGVRTTTTSPMMGSRFALNDFSTPDVCRDAFSLNFSSNAAAGSLWSRQPFEQFGVADKTRLAEGENVGNKKNSVFEDQETGNHEDLESKLLQSFRHCIVRMLKLEGSDWLFRQNDGADEDLIDRVAARERFLFDAESRVDGGESQFSSNQKSSVGSPQRSDDSDYKFLVTSVPNCGEGCIWRADLIISFGVWCIHRILELSLMESRPELWGKYTYVLNRLQGIIDLAFSKPRSPMTPCFCLQIPVSSQQKLSPAVSNGSLPPPARQGRGKSTTSASLLDIIKDVETAISCRKGRTGTAAGDVAFPKGKENLASVLKRYKRRLSNKPVSGDDRSRKVPASSPPYSS